MIVIIDYFICYQILFYFLQKLFFKQNLIYFCYTLGHEILSLKLWNFVLIWIEKHFVIYYVDFYRN